MARDQFSTLPQWIQLVSAVQQDRLPHALLLQGSSEKLQSEFTAAWIQWLLCKALDKQNLACGRCSNCHLFEKNNHPDVRVVVPEERAIKIEAVRNLIQFVNQTAQLNDYQIVIIDPADAMNNAAQNALLKTLEEPAGQKSVFLLLTTKPFLLAPTIRSRCQSLILTGAPTQISPESAELHDLILNGLYEIKHSAGSPVDIAATWSKQEIIKIIEGLLFWTITLIRSKAVTSIDLMGNTANTTELFAYLKQQLPVQALFGYLDLLYEVRRLLLQQSNVNIQLLLELILIRWKQL